MKVWFACVLAVFKDTPGFSTVSKQLMRGTSLPNEAFLISLAKMNYCDGV